MLWVLLFVGIALAGLAMLVGFAVWLWRKAGALLDEAGTAGDRVGELFDLLAQVGVPGRPRAEDEDEDDREPRVGDGWSGAPRT